MHIHLEKYMYFFPHYRQNAHLLVFRWHLYIYIIQVIIIMFIIFFQPRTLCRYFAVILESVTGTDFTNLISPSFYKASITF